MVCPEDLTMPLSKLPQRTKLAQRALIEGRPISLTVRHKPLGLLVSYIQYNHLLNTLRLLLSPLTHREASSFVQSILQAARSEPYSVTELATLLSTAMTIAPPICDNPPSYEELRTALIKEDICPLCLTKNCSHLSPTESSATQSQT